MRKHVILIISILVFIFAIIIGYFYIYLPQIHTIEDKKVQLKEELGKNEIVYSINQVRQQIRKYDKHLPNNTDYSWIVSKVSDKVKSSRVELISIRPMDIEYFDNYAVMAVNLKIKTTFHRLGKFISQIESAPDFLKIESVQLVKIFQSKKEPEQFAGDLKDRTGSTLANVELVVSTIYAP